MSTRVRGLVLAAWPLGLAVVLLLPLLTQSGHPLARDLMFVPRQPWTDATIGLGDAAPRAVPLDSVMALVTSVLDGGVVARIALVLVLAGAGWGVGRLVAPWGTWAALVASGFAVWNPYVVERLALGQWALLVTYAALPWLVLACQSYASSGARVDLARVAGWCVLGSVTPSGGVMVVAAVLVLVGAAVVDRWPAVLVAVLVQAPWVVAGLLSTAGGTSDPAGVSAFAPDTEGPGGPVVAVLALGGVWDSLSEPATHTTWWAVVAGVVVTAIVGACVLLTRRTPGGGVRRLLLLGIGALAVVLCVSVPPGQQTLEWMVAHVPGAGLARDGQKFLAPYVVAAAASLGVVTSHLRARLAHHGTEVVGSLAVSGLLLPGVLLPDATTVTWPTVEPVTYPTSLDTVASILDDAAESGDHTMLATLPWRSYRRFNWGNGLTSADPAARWFDRQVLVSDDLRVGRELVPGESGLARRVGDYLDGDRSLRGLGRFGIGWVLVYEDDPDRGSPDTGDLVPVHEDDRLSLFRVPAPREPEAVSPRRRALVIAGHGVYAGIALWSAATFLRRRKSALR